MSSLIIDPIRAVLYKSPYRSSVLADNSTISYEKHRRAQFKIMAILGASCNYNTVYIDLTNYPNYIVIGSTNDWVCIKNKLNGVGVNPSKGSGIIKVPIGKLSEM